VRNAAPSRRRVVTMDGNLSGRGGSLYAGAFAGAEARTRPAANTGDAALILASFPGPVTLHPGRRKFVLALAGCLAFVAIAIWLLQEGSLSPAGTAKVWLGLVVFGVCALVPAVMLLPGAGRLTLDAGGFEQVSLYVKRRVPWHQVGNFTVRQYSLRGRNNYFVGYDDARLRADNMNRRMIGRNAALPDTYGLAHDELASLMTQWRARALAPSR
jgi:hypothetical protein